MANAGTPHRFFKISELASLTAAHLTEDGAKESVVSFARVCRYLEEPALSVVWKTQRSFLVLLKVLPEEHLEWLSPGFNTTVRGWFIRWRN